ncbi:MAG: glycoside hydrolase family 88 protein [Bacteroidales bacterium]|nr:glycoside hydrolase family 88 protein [Bacteroidales bacterium]
MIKVKTLLLIILFTLSFIITRCKDRSAQIDPLDYAIKMADSEMKRNPDAWMLDFMKSPKWNYTNGLVCTAFEQLWKVTGNEKYYNYIKEYADTIIDSLGNIDSYKLKDYNIDKINPGKFLFALYEKTGDTRYKNAIDTLREQMRTHPRTSEGGFWHKKRYPCQMWLDGLYMGTPFLAQYAYTFHEDSLFNDVAKQIHLIDIYTRDSVTGLYYHGWDESREQAWANKATGKSPNVWGRGMGWYAMTLVDVLDFFPADHPKRYEIIDITRHMAKAIAEYQDDSTGVWYQVVDKGGEKGNYLESSASTMFVYFLIKAINNNYIDASYMPVTQKGYDGIIKQFIKENPDGTISISQACAGAGLGGNPYRDGSYEYYVNEFYRDDDPKAVGPFILLMLEFNKLEHPGPR